MVSSTRATGKGRFEDREIRWQESEHYLGRLGTLDHNGEKKPIASAVSAKRPRISKIDTSRLSASHSKQQNRRKIDNKGDRNAAASNIHSSSCRWLINSLH